MIEPLHTDEPVSELTWDDPTDLVAIRNLMILREKAIRARTLKKDLLAQITHLYRDEIDRLDDRIERIEESVKTGLIRVNGGEPARFPDVGTAYLRKTPEKILVDSTMLATVSQELGTGTDEWVPDVAATKKRLLEAIHRSGEVPSGVTVVPADVDVTIRGL